MSKLPSKVGSKNRYNAVPLLTREEVRARVGGINPNSLAPDDEGKFEIFEKVRKFYVLYTDGSRVREGLGEIVNWTVDNGVAELNKRLINLYKFDLEAVVEHLKDDAILFERKSMRKKTLGRTNGVKASTKSTSVNTLRMKEDVSAYIPQSSAAPQPSEEVIREKLIEFYKKHDPTMLENLARIDNVVQYAVRKGVQKLNLKLQKKFQTKEGLDIHEEEPPGATSHSSVNRSIPSGSGGKANKTFSTLLREAEKSKTRSRSKTANSTGIIAQIPTGNQAMLSLAGSRRILPSVAKDFDNKSRLPPQLKLFLKMYYSCYDPVYIIRDKLQGAKLYAEEVGLEKFDASLRTKYKESLTDFQGRVELLQDRLQNFYLAYDLKRANEVLMSVLQWTLRNGEVSLNRELRGRYGDDLSNFTNAANQGEPVATLPNEDEPRF